VRPALEGENLELGTFTISSDDISLSYGVDENFSGYYVLYREVVVVVATMLAFLYI
jgi:hypothetical protein